MKTDREKALEWWSLLTNSQKLVLTERWLNISVKKEMKNLINENIIKIYQLESNFQNYGKQVDFKILFAFIKATPTFVEFLPSLKEEFENLKLFLELLAKSSTFAHKAHKELKQLNM